MSIAPYTKMTNVKLMTEDHGALFVIKIIREDGKNLTLQEIGAALALMSQRIVEELKKKLS